MESHPAQPAAHFLEMPCRREPTPDVGVVSSSIVREVREGKRG